jgi:hypothetical protein
LRIFPVAQEKEEDSAGASGAGGQLSVVSCQLSVETFRN